MLLVELQEWERWRIRLQAQEALLALQVAHGDARETANMLTATACGIKKEVYEERKSQAMMAVAALKATLGRKRHG